MKTAPRISLRSAGFICLAFLAAAEVAMAADPFAVNVQTTGGTPQTINVAGNSVSDLAQDLVRTESKFSALNGQPFNASIRYGGLNNAATYSQNGAGTSATLSFPTTGFSRTFTAANKEDLRDQIRDFLKSDGSDEYSRLLRSLNEQTQIGVTDGNPLATTALLSNLPYYEWGLQRRPFADPRAEERVFGGFHLDLSGGSFDTDGNQGGGWFGTATLTSGIRFNDRIGLAWGTMFSYRDLDGASTYHVGTAIGLPILLVPQSASNPWSWQLTPAFLAGASGSLDQAAGGTFLGGSLTSSLSFRSAPFTVTIGNQISFLEGFPIDIGDYDFDTDLSQQILKNGIDVAIDLGPGALLDVGITYTNFLQDAAVDSYWSPTVGISFRFSPDSGLRIAYQGDLGDGFQAHGGSVMLYLNY